MVPPSSKICLVIGTPRGFTRSVLEALLKRGTRVILACPDPSLGQAEHKRLSGLYGPSQISLNVVQTGNVRALESLLLRALDTHGGVSCILNSTADDKLKVDRSELRGGLEEVDRYLNQKQQQHDVQAINNISKLAIKYLGKQNGFFGGSLLNLSSGTELLRPQLKQQQHNLNIKTVNQIDAVSLQQSGAVQVSECHPQRPSRRGPTAPRVGRTTTTTVSPRCTVLGTTRALGLSAQVAKHGVNVCTVYEPNIDYPDLSVAAQITDDEHSPYYTWNRYSAYCREYTGYMALHVAETAPSGTAWSFNSDLRLQRVEPDMIPSTCKVANKMCYWLGCPHVPDHPVDNDLNGQEVHLQEAMQGEACDTTEVGRRGWTDVETVASALPQEELQDS